jgi:c-di-AMP phosphodiesterase-like protein
VAIFTCRVRLLAAISHQRRWGADKSMVSQTMAADFGGFGRRQAVVNAIRLIPGSRH